MYSLQLFHHKLMSALMPLVVHFVFSAPICSAVDVLPSRSARVCQVSFAAYRAVDVIGKIEVVIVLPPMLIAPLWSSTLSAMVLSRKMLSSVGESRHSRLNPTAVLNQSPNTVI